MTAESFDMLRVLLEDHRARQSTLQNVRFVVAKSGRTDYGGYRQALRELSTRSDGIREAVVERRLAEVDVLEARHLLDSPHFCGLCSDADCSPPAPSSELARAHFERMRVEARATRASARVAALDRELRELEREWQDFFLAAVALRRRLGLADGETLDDERRAELERGFWRAELESRAVGNQIGRELDLPQGVAEAIDALPPEDAEVVRRRVVDGRAEHLVLDLLPEELSTVSLPALPVRRLLESREG